MTLDCYMIRVTTTDIEIIFTVESRSPEMFRSRAPGTRGSLKGMIIRGWITEQYDTETHTIADRDTYCLSLSNFVDRPTVYIKHIYPHEDAQNDGDIHTSLCIHSEISFLSPLYLDTPSLCPLIGVECRTRCQ
jgi:hypothetical protein